MSQHTLFVCASCTFAAGQREYLGQRGGYHLCLPALDSAIDIVQLAIQYASRDGVIPRRDRPALLQKGILARIPPVLPPQA